MGVKPKGWLEDAKREYIGKKVEVRGGHVIYVRDVLDCPGDMRCFHFVDLAKNVYPTNLDEVHDVGGLDSPHCKDCGCPPHLYKCDHCGCAGLDMGEIAKEF